MSAPLDRATAYALGVLYDAMDRPPDADLPGGIWCDECGIRTNHRGDQHREDEGGAR